MNEYVSKLSNVYCLAAFEVAGCCKCDCSVLKLIHNVAQPKGNY